MPYCFEKSNYKDIDKYNEYRKNDKKKWKKKLTEYLESKKKPCLFCNSTEKIEFHHINPVEKEYTVTALVSCSYKRIDEEVSKCWCLCHSCHKKLHRRMCDPLPSCYENS